MGEPLTNSISVVIPCFNHEQYLSETLESIIAQTCPTWEALVVDDGSTDNSPQIAQQYASCDSRIKYVRQENQGPSVARNTGIQRSSGQYVQFLDADDLLRPEKFAMQIAEFQHTPAADIVYSGYLCFDALDRSKVWTYSRVELNKNPLNDFAAHWEKGLSIPIHCFLYKKSCFERWGVFDSAFLSSNEDWDLHMHFALSGARFFFVPGQTSLYRVCPGSRARNESEMFEGKLTLLKKYLKSDNVPIRTKVILLQRYLETLWEYRQFRNR